jgi:hypothetical protein
MFFEPVWTNWGQIFKLTPDNSASAGDTPDELVECRSDHIKGWMLELAHPSQQLAVHGGDGRLIGYAHLRRVDDSGITMTLGQQARHSLEWVKTSVNIMASTRRGKVLFTLQVTGIDMSLCLSAAMPRAVIRVQSREYYRVSVLSGRHRQALLRLPGAAQTLPVHDLSEQGLGLRLDRPELTDIGKPLLSSALELDGQTLLLPVLEIVYSGPTNGQRWRIGARIHGLSAPDGRALRHWIDIAETGG